MAPARGEAVRAGKRIAATKRDERQVRQQRIKAKRIAFAVLALVVVGAALFGARAVYNSSFMSIRKVEVKGNRHLSREEIVQQAAVPPGVTQLRLDRDPITRRLMKNPWIESASIERVLPSGLRIVVEERIPGAVVDLGGGSVWTVSSRGVWLMQGSLESTSLVTVRDLASVEPTAGAKTESPELLNTLEIIRKMTLQVRDQVQVISAPTVDKTAITTKDNVEVFVGSADRIEEKLRVAQEILEREKGRVVYINVRVVDRPTWRGL